MNSQINTNFLLSDYDFSFRKDTVEIHCGIYMVKTLNKG